MAIHNASELLKSALITSVSPVSVVVPNSKVGGDNPIRVEITQGTVFPRRLRLDGTGEHHLVMLATVVAPTGGDDEGPTTETGRLVDLIKTALTPGTLLGGGLQVVSAPSMRTPYTSKGEYRIPMTVRVSVDI